MILKFLFILILINITTCDIYTKENYFVNTAFKYTSDFFEKLKLNYGINFLIII